MTEHDDYRMDISYERGKVRAVVHPDVQIAWFSFVLEQGIEWMLGKAVHRFMVGRNKTADGLVELVMETDNVVPQALKFAAVASIETLGEEHYIPISLKYRYPIADNSSIVNSEGLRPEVTIHELSYGLSDMIVAFFLKGAQNVRYQISRESAQLWVDLGMTQRQMIDFLNTDRDYGPETTLRDLSWKA